MDSSSGGSWKEKQHIFWFHGDESLLSLVRVLVISNTYMYKKWTRLLPLKKHQESRSSLSCVLLDMKRGHLTWCTNQMKRKHTSYNYIKFNVHFWNCKFFQWFILVCFFINEVSIDLTFILVFTEQSFKMFLYKIILREGTSFRTA